MSETEMVEVKTADLIGPALDWAVAKAVPQKHWPVIVGGKVMLDTDYDHIPYSPSTTWQDGGPLIDSLVAIISKRVEGSWWSHSGNNLGEGPSALIAACRAIVASKLGDKIHVPKELMQ